MSQQMHEWAAAEEQERSNAEAAAANRRRAKDKKAYDKAHPEEADIEGWLKFFGVVLVALLLLWAHYGPIVRDAIYGPGG